MFTVRSHAHLISIRQYYRNRPSSHLDAVLEPDDLGAGQGGLTGQGHRLVLNALGLLQRHRDDGGHRCGFYDGGHGGLCMRKTIPQIIMLSNNIINYKLAV